MNKRLQQFVEDTTEFNFVIDLPAITQKANRVVENPIPVAIEVVDTDATIVMPIVTPTKVITENKPKPNLSNKDVVKVNPVESPVEPVIVTHVAPSTDKVRLPKNGNALPIAISKCGNAIKTSMIKNQMYEKVLEYIVDKKMSAELFYQRVQNCCFHTLKEYCGLLTRNNAPDVIPEITEDMPNLSTIIFLDNFIRDKHITPSNDKLLDGVMDRYRKSYNGGGIHPSWISFLKKRLIDKFKSGKKGSTQILLEGIDDICTFLYLEWCDQSIPLMESTTSTTSSDLFEDVPPKPVEEISSIPIIQEESVDEPEDEIDDEMEEDDETCSCDCEDDEDDSDESGEIGRASIDVNIMQAGSSDIISVLAAGDSDDVYTQIPFYVNLMDLINAKDTDTLPSVVDDRNGIWDWLIHIPSPEFMFQTLEPEKYLKGNNCIETSHIKHVIMDNENGLYTIGVYWIDADLGRVEEGDEGIAKHVNRLIKENIAGTPMSYLPIAVGRTELFITEEDVIENMDNFMDKWDDSSDEEDDSEDESEVDLVEAAFQSMTIADTESADPVDASDFVYTVKHRRNKIDI